MPKLNIPPKQDYVSDITDDEINKNYWHNTQPTDVIGV